MDISLILKIAGVGVLVAVANQVLRQMGRDDQAALVSLAGVVLVLLMMVGEIDRLMSSVKSVFGL